MSMARAIRWVLTGGAFVAVMGTAGCAHRAQTEAVAQAEVPGASDSFQDPFAVSNAPAVNVFGEFAGQTLAPAMPVGASGFQQHTFVDEGYDSAVSIDPTGKWFVFASTRHSEHPDIYLQRCDGLAVQKLTEDPADDAYPTFSPDGKKIAFASNRTGNWQIYLTDLDGKNVTQATSGTMQCVHPSFSPDCGRLVFSSLGARSNQWELWTVDLGTMEKRQIGYGLFPVWSPEKGVDRIAFQRARQRGSRWFSLWTVELLNNEAHHLTEVAVSTNAAIVSPGFSPDGKRLAFATIVEPTLRNGRKVRGQQDIWTVNLDGTNRQRLTDGNGTNLSPSWSADNQIFFISDRGGNESVWSVPAQVPMTFTASTEGKAKKAEAVGATDSSEIGR